MSSFAAGVAEGGGAGGSSPPGAARPAASPSLECLGNTVRVKEGRKVEQGPITQVCGDRCKDWFCPHCAHVQGPRLRARLIDRVENWKNPLMLTFTIDRDLLPSAEAAFKHVADRRAISKVMQELKPFISRPAWFCVVEFQKDGGWPHWHVLLDSPCVPIPAVRKAWRRFVPRAVRHLIRPSIDSLGIVRFSKPDGFQNPKHAVLYVTKYLTKCPEEGFPKWVMDAKYRIRRFGTSRGFWGELEHRKPCEKDGVQPRRRSHGERIKTCCETSTVYAVKERKDEQTGQIVRDRQFLGRIQCNGRWLGGIMRALAEKLPGFGLYARGAFVSFLGTWREFKESFGSEVEYSAAANLLAVSLRFAGDCRIVESSVQSVDI